MKLLREVQELSFVKCELELFLDTHPDCAQARDYFEQTVSALDSRIDEYESKYGPITAKGALRFEGWNWVDGDWPWYSGLPNTTEKHGGR